MDYMGIVLNQRGLQDMPVGKGSLQWRVGGVGRLLPPGGVLERFTLQLSKSSKGPKLMYIRNWADPILNDLSVPEGMPSDAAISWFVYLCDEKGIWSRQFEDSSMVTTQRFGATIEAINDKGNSIQYLKAYRGKSAAAFQSFTFDSGKIMDGREIVYPEEWPPDFVVFSPQKEWIVVADYIAQPHPKWHKGPMPTNSKTLDEMNGIGKNLTLAVLQEIFKPCNNKF